MSRRVGCPGSGRLPADEAANQSPPPWLPPDRAMCSRCGGVYRLRKDGRVIMHRVPEADVVPMIRGARCTSGRIESRRA